MVDGESGQGGGEQGGADTGKEGGLAPRKGADPAAGAAGAGAAGSGDPAGKPPAQGTPPARPDYIPEKFWDAAAGAPNSEVLARSYTALEKRFGGFTGAPAADKDGNVPYELKTADPRVNALLVEDDPHWQGAKEFFAKWNCSQEFVSECLTLQGQIFGANNATSMAEQQAILRKAGYNDTRMEDFSNRWAGLVGDETYDTMANEFFRTAEGVLFFDRVLWPMISGGKMPANIGGDNGAGKTGGATLQELYAQREKATGAAREMIENQIRETSRQLAGE